MWVIPCFLSAGGALLLGGVLFSKRARNPIFIPLAMVLVVEAWIHGINGITMFLPEHFLTLKKLILFGELALPVALGYVTHAFFREISPGPAGINKIVWMVMVAGAGILGASLYAWPEGMMQVSSNGEILFARPAGLAIWGFILIALVIGLSQLEQIFRVTRDPLRFQMKFVDRKSVV